MKKLLLLVIVGVFALSANAHTPTPWPKASVLTVIKTDAPITIDGKFDEPAWALASGDSLKRWYYTDTFASLNDCSGAFKALWDDTALYVAITVTDDSIVDHNWNGSTFAAWQMDLLELYINSNTSNLWNGGSSPAVCSPCQGSNGTYQFVQAVPNKTTTPSTWTPNIKMAATFDTVSKPHKYYYEYAIDWTDIPKADGSTYFPTLTDSLGFDLNITDNDGTGRRRIVWSNCTATENFTNMKWAGRLLFASYVSEAVKYNYINGSSIELINNNTLRFSNIKAKNLKVYNLLGAEVFNVNVTSNEVNVSSLRFGLYIAKAGGVNYKFVKR